jgi:hypothetical protein
MDLAELGTEVELISGHWKSKLFDLPNLKKFGLLEGLS